MRLLQCPFRIGKWGGEFFEQEAAEDAEVGNNLCELCVLLFKRVLAGLAAAKIFAALAVPHRDWESGRRIFNRRKQRKWRIGIILCELCVLLFKCLFAGLTVAKVFATLAMPVLDWEVGRRIF